MLDLFCLAAVKTLIILHHLKPCLRVQNEQKVAGRWEAGGPGTLEGDGRTCLRKVMVSRTCGYRGSYFLSKDPEKWVNQENIPRLRLICFICLCLFKSAADIGPLPLHLGNSIYWK